MNRILIISVIVACCYGRVIIPRSGCSISVNKHLSDPQPLILLQNEATHFLDAFPLPVDSRGTLSFSKNEFVDLACPGSSLLISGSNTGKDFLEAKCVNQNNFLIQGRSVRFESITCKKLPYHVARYSGKKCGGKYKEIEIGFNVNNRFIKHVISCFDNALQHVLYSQANLTSTIEGYQFDYPRPNFVVANFYNVSPDSVSYLYSRNGQRKTINKILGFNSGNSSIIHPNDDYFLSRGHYVPKVDFVFGAQQRSTFYYVNVAPQWQTFNGGNWNTLEMDVRSFASKRDLNLVTYTGSYGITTLPDAKGVQQEIYLWKGKNNKKGIPVPAIMFKIVYEPKSQAAIALIGVNNPYKDDIKDHIICTDICDKIKWLSWEQDDIELGYSYCCEVNDFRRTVKFLPHFPVTHLLT